MRKPQSGNRSQMSWKKRIISASSRSPQLAAKSEKQVKTGLISGLNTLGHVCCGETDYPDHSCDRVAARFFAKHSHDPVEASAVTA